MNISSKFRISKSTWLPSPTVLGGRGAGGEGGLANHRASSSTLNFRVKFKGKSSNDTRQTAKPLTPSPFPRSTEARGEKTWHFACLPTCDVTNAYKSDELPSLRSVGCAKLSVLAWSIALLILTCCPQRAESAEPPVVVPFELQPYRVHFSVAFADAADLGSELRKSILLELPAAADRVLAEMWSVTADENPWLLPASAEQLATLTPELLPADWLTETYDKTFLITVESLGGEFLLSGREWDHVGRTLGRPLSRRVQQRRELPGAVFKLGHELFRPLLSIEKVADGVASVIVKAGALSPADPSFVQMKTKQFWQPFVRTRNSKGEVEKCQSVPWTMLQVESLSAQGAAYGQAKVVSGLRAAIPRGKRSRVDVFARLLEPVTSVTELRLVSRQNTARPLVGVVVEAVVKPEEPAKRYLTDRNGAVRIAAQPDVPLIWLYVRSGQKTLARLPLAPGLESTAQAELPDDSIRLRVEGELSILEATLTDTVAQRAVLIARIRKFVQFNDWKAAAVLRRDLKTLPGPDYFLKELNAVRIPAIQAAQAAKDRSATAYIERACGESAMLIQKYLDEDKLRAFEEELKELEKAPPIKPPVQTKEKKA